MYRNKPFLRKLKDKKEYLYQQNHPRVRRTLAWGAFFILHIPAKTGIK